MAVQILSILQPIWVEWESSWCGLPNCHYTSLGCRIIVWKKEEAGNEAVANHLSFQGWAFMCPLVLFISFLHYLQMHALLVCFNNTRLLEMPEPQTSQGTNEISPCSSVSLSPVSLRVSVIVEDVFPLFNNIGVQKVQQEDNNRGCRLTKVSTIL